MYYTGKGLDLAVRSVLHVGKQLEMYYTGKGLHLAVKSVLHVGKLEMYYTGKGLHVGVVFLNMQRWSTAYRKTMRDIVLYWEGTRSSSLGVEENYYEESSCLDLPLLGIVYSGRGVPDPLTPDPFLVLYISRGMRRVVLGQKKTKKHKYS